MLRVRRLQPPGASPNPRRDKPSLFKVRQVVQTFTLKSRPRWPLVTERAAELLAACSARIRGQPREHPMICMADERDL